MTQTITKAAALKLERDYAIERLLTYYVKEGKTIYTACHKASSSGLSQDIALYVADGETIANITYYAAHALGYKLVEASGHRAIRQTGGGMDLGFNLVYNLSSVLFHGQERAGYVLKHAWI